MRIITRYALIFVFFIVLLFCNNLLHAQSDDLKNITNHTPVLAVKSNLLYDATTTLNIGAEFKIGEKLTLDIPFNLNAWTFSGNKKLKHWMLQPELRYWLCSPFSGHFFGLHAHSGQFNVGGIDLPFDVFPTLKEHRYEGWFAGGGISYGYHWILSNRWSLEATVGVGYVYFDYDKYKCETCGKKVKSDEKDYWGPTKAGLSLIYIIK